MQKSFNNLYESVKLPFTYNGKSVELAALDPTTSTITINGSPNDVHNSKIYINKGKFKGKTVQYALSNNGSSELEKLMK